MNIADEIMSFTFSGDPADPIKRHLTGLHSFDNAFKTAKGEIGMPIGTGYEVFGSKSIGKSTWCYSMAGILGKSLETGIHLADLEGFDAGHLGNILSHVKYTGNVHLTHQGTDEDILEKFADSFLELGDFKNSKIKYGVGVLDSIAAISPISEKEGEFGGATYGRRAVLVGLMARKLLPTAHPRTVGSENLYFLVNHWYPKVGGQKFEYISPGGNVKNYLCGVQIHLARKKNYDDGSYVLQGTLYKNRYGFNKTKFSVFIKSGVGIHRGLTNIIDCRSMGLLDAGKLVKIDGKSYGYITKIMTKEWENDDFFTPFYNLLKEKEDEV